jgi:DNA polymerase I-like protein with 3'-5' exonuclease and polymerase domains
MFCTTKLSPGHFVARTNDEMTYMVNAIKSATTIGIDFETTGSRPFNGAHPIGYSMGFLASDGRPYSWYVPVAHTTPEPMADMPAAKRAFRDAVFSASELVGHNLKFDLNMARKWGYDIPLLTPLHDTLIQAYLIDENRPFALEKVVNYEGISPWGDAMSMKNELTAYLKVKAKERGLLFQKRTNKRGYWEAPYIERFGHSEVWVSTEAEYSCRDIAHTLLLDRTQRDRAMGLGTPYEDRRRFLYWNEMMLVRALAEMQWNGQPVDKPYLLKMAVELDEDLERRAADLTRRFGARISWSNDNDVRDFLYNHLKLPVKERTKVSKTHPKGQPSVSRSALMQLRPHHSAIEHLAEFNVWLKIRSTYSDSLAYYVDQDGKIHGDVMQFGTGTGRFAMKGPNLQNIPFRHKEASKRVRQAFMTVDGMVRLFLDYSQVELRVLGWRTAAKVFIAAYRSPSWEAMMRGDISIEAYMRERANEPRRDIHGEVAIATLGSKPEDSDWKVKRRAGKVINFGVPYGGGHSMLTSNPELMLGEKAAKALYERYHRKNPEIDRTKEKLFAAMRGRRGCYFTNWAGRCRHLPALKSRGNDMRSRAERMAFASLIQGEAGELTRLSIVRTYIMQRDGTFPGKATNTVHDEIQFDCDKKDLVEVARKGQLAMEDFHGYFGSIPIIVDAEVTETTWADKKDYEVSYE